MSDVLSLINESVFIIREALNRFEKPAVLWSTGKDSTTCLSLIREACFGVVPIPVIHIDTGLKFKEIYEFRDRIASEWNLDLLIAKNEDAWRWTSPEKNREECCTQRKTNALKLLMQREGFDALFVAIRRDEHGIRGMERVMSPRTKDWRWLYLEQEAELWSLYQTEFKGADHVRIHPILNWTEPDVWEYVKLRGLPVNPLYWKGYRSLGCHTCTKPVWRDPPKSLDDIISRVKKEKGLEREGRTQDKEREYVMLRLRHLGYM
ncbi:MAG: sulfate adenylyltransferase subunit CysD [Methanosarcinales archaeon]